MTALINKTAISPSFQPQNNKQAYLAYLNGLNIELPAPRTTEEALLYKLCESGVSGGGANGSDALIITARDAEGHPISVDASGLTVLHEAQFYAGRSNCPWYKTKTFILPKDITELPAYVFAYCAGLESYNIPSGVETIGNYAFNLCSGLKRVVFSNTVRTIGDHAFDKCTALTDVVLNDGLLTINDYAFRDCSALTSVIIPQSVELIDSYAFMGCTKLATVTFEGTPEEISSAAFMNVTSVTDIYVPWAEGAVIGAPWGATNATVHYGG